MKIYASLVVLTLLVSNGEEREGEGKSEKKR